MSDTFHIPKSIDLDAPGVDWAIKWNTLEICMPDGKSISIEAEFDAPKNFDWKRPDDCNIMDDDDDWDVNVCDGCNEGISYNDKDGKGGICLDCDHCASCGCDCIDGDDDSDSDECEGTRRICYLCNKECSCWNYNIEHKVICTDCECWPHEEETPKDQTVS